MSINTLHKGDDDDNNNNNNNNTHNIAANLSLVFMTHSFYKRVNMLYFVSISVAHGKLASCGINFNRLQGKPNDKFILPTFILTQNMKTSTLDR